MDTEVPSPHYSARRRADVRAAEARAREAAANYESLHWNACLEAESALASEETLSSRQGTLRDSQRSTWKAALVAEQRFAAGVGDVFSVLALQRSALEAESAVLALQRARIDN